MSTTADPIDLICELAERSGKRPTGHRRYNAATTRSSRDATKTATR